jgi:hypothetical protein
VLAKKVERMATIVDIEALENDGEAFVELD